MRAWGWIIQRLTGFLLIVLLLVHLLATHFSAPSAEITFGTVVSRLKMPGFVLVDYSLLFLGLVHGMYGLYIVFTDTIRTVSPKLVSVTLIVLGVVLGTMGAYTLSAFLG